MKSCKVIVLLLFLLMSLSQTACWSEDWTEVVTLKFPQDEKDWHEGWSQKDDDGSYIMEFVHDGQTVEDWKELVTWNFLAGLQKKLTPEQYMEIFLQHLKAASPNVISKQISSSDNDVIVQWQLHDDKNNPDQWELVRVLKGQKALHVIHYAKKSTNIDPNEQATWLKFLQSSGTVEQATKQ